MAELDSRLVERFQTFLASLDVTVPGGTRTIGDYTRPGLADEIRAVIATLEPVVAADETAPDMLAERSKAEAVLHETHMRAQEMSFLLLCATVRRPDLREVLMPRVGVTHDEHARNLLDMRHRVSGHESELRVGDARLGLPTHLSDRAVTEQVDRHTLASLELARRRAPAVLSPDQKDTLKTKATALQRQVNGVLEMLFPDDRALQTKYGLSSRAQQRKR